MKKTILFLCTHNSARSQMAEGLVNSLFSERYEAYSAGTEPSSLNPFAVKVMGEIGVSMENQYSKAIDEFDGKRFNYVVTVCDNAKESCPAYLNAEKFIHKSFIDPSSVEGDDERKLNMFRKTRDEIKSWLESIFT